MELGTFGAILGFALELEERAVAAYEGVARSGQREPFEQLAQGSLKRRDRLLRARREMVSEMILEAITGLDAEAYCPTLESPKDDPEALAQALELEAAAARFYRDAAAKMPIREVVRLFERLARENERRQGSIASRLEALGADSRR